MCVCIVEGRICSSIYWIPNDRVESPHSLAICFDISRLVDMEKRVEAVILTFIVMGFASPLPLFQKYLLNTFKTKPLYAL